MRTYATILRPTICRGHDQVRGARVGDHLERLRRRPDLHRCGVLRIGKVLEFDTRSIFWVRPLREAQGREQAERHGKRAPCGCLFRVVSGGKLNTLVLQLFPLFAPRVSESTRQSPTTTTKHLFMLFMQ